ncbi:MAG: hypothetical protein IAE83_10895 [Anaerolinea sp.]|nr:hypothetical protein [Anaerolinea sp.]MCC6976235.1 hypothetical protein [Anaerolineae bacterium]CAG1010464.1 hypothetical protein ANRL4_04196 [Anaerolineae bacterium]
MMHNRSHKFMRQENVLLLTEEDEDLFDSGLPVFVDVKRGADYEDEEFDDEIDDFEDDEEFEDDEFDYDDDEDLDDFDDEEEDYDDLEDEDDDEDEDM